jgi:hypothetical protein
MRSHTRSYYGFSEDFCQAGYFETEASQRIVKELAHKMVVLQAGNGTIVKEWLARRMRLSSGAGTFPMTS